ncbi:hypothetical protein GCM10007304_09530 [Rhodococcoides trifolii]|uniref:Carrier domain-containing protein n=1 Tax=Rhodococcoides trifolii TaxID=908250 RepID=A0A917CU00_9NOCA|nr:non-ribosomal peptide synthetase [Rhodococcus trifolii]GGF97707.1 hypothetical protein GCM10007304_09530 [Rhodococcus trifolii]
MIDPSVPRDIVPLSAAQRSLWLAQQLAPETAFTVALYLDIEGLAGIDSLLQTMYTAGAEHGLAYVRIVDVRGDPMITLDMDAPYEIDVIDLRDHIDNVALAHEWMTRDFTTPVVLHDTLLLRGALLRLTDDRTFLYFRSHHLVLDGFGAFTLINRMADMHSGRELSGPPPDATDIVGLHSIEAKYADSDRHARDLAHWRGALADVAGPSTFSTRPPTAPAQPRAMRVPWLGSAELSDVDSAALIAAFALYLSAVTDSPRVVVGLPVSGRTTAFLRGTGGMLANVLPIEVVVSQSDTITQLVRQVRLAVTTALRHQRFQDWDRVVDVELRTFGVFFGPVINVMPFVAPLDFGAVRAPVHILSSGPVHDIAVNVYPGTDPHLDIQWNPSRYTESEIALHGNRLTRIMDAVLVDDGTTTVRQVEVHDGTNRPVPRHGGRAAPAQTLRDLLRTTVDANPSAIALISGSETLDFTELDHRSNRLARRLIAGGAGSDTVVALALPRSIDYLVSMWAVTKTGAAFLPLDPDQPAERLGRIIAELSVTQGITLSSEVADAHDEVHWTGPSADASTDSIHVPIAVDHVAYLIYTSGSTGRPKGVAVTHRGLASFVAAQQTRLGTPPTGARVLAVASPTFDASIAEVLLALSMSAPLVVTPPSVYAGEPLRRFIADNDITHAILTPTTLESMNPAGLDTLQTVISVGEQCTPDVTRRYAQGRSLYNDYGPTETTIWATGTSRLEPGAPVTIGAPIAGTTARVLDSHLRDAPVGAVGELYVAGAGLARGYAGQTGITSTRFVAAADGTRVYRTGDRVRWNLSGELDFLGRTDSQIKIRGRRIELGEIDDALRGQPGVTSAVTVVRDGGTLAAFVTGEVDTDELGRALSQILPAYMVPDVITALAELPTTASGKIDRRALPTTVTTTAVYRDPVSDVERTVAAVFAEVLGARGSVGRDDDFFALGGDSIVSIRLVTVLAERGLRLSARDIFENRTVARIAHAARAAEDHEEGLDELPGGGVGSIDPTPIVRRMIQRPGSFDRFSQSMLLELPVGIDRSTIVEVVGAVVDTHDMLRSRLYRGADGARAFEASAPGSVDVDAVLECIDSGNRTATTELDRVVGLLDPATGSVLRLLWFAAPDGAGQLLVVVHHIAVDGVSWRILVADLVRAWSNVSAGRPAAVPPVATSMRRWARGLHEIAVRTDIAAQQPMWRRIVEGGDPALGSRHLDPARDLAVATKHLELALDDRATDALVRRGPAVFHGHAHDALVAALAMAVTVWRRRRGVEAPTTAIRMEGHGREDSVLPGADTSRTVGWFTTVYPMRVDLTDIDIDSAMDGAPAAGAAIRAAKEAVAEIPDGGIGYGILDLGLTEPQIALNYLGRVSSSDLPEGAGWRPIARFGDLVATPDADMPADSVIGIDAVVEDGRLTARVGYLDTLLERTDAEELVDLWRCALLGLAAHIDSDDAGGHTPSDFPLIRLSQNAVDDIVSRYPSTADVWPLAPLQSGLMFHALLAQSTADLYIVESVVELVGVVDTARLHRAAQTVLDRHANLRAAFVTTADGGVAQVVVEGVTVPWREIDLSSERHPENAFARSADARRSEPVDITAPPLIGFTLVTMAPDRWRLVITNHHILLDGWSMPLLLNDLLTCYGQAGAAEPTPRPFRDYLEWVAAVDTTAGLDAWTAALRGVDVPSRIARAAAGSGTSGERLFDLDQVTTARISHAARSIGVTLNTMVTFAWGVVLGTHTGGRDVVFGATVSGRPPELDGAGSMIGLFINTIPVRVGYDPAETVDIAVTRLQAEQAALLPHHHVELSAIAAAVGPGVDFDTTVAFESYPVDRDAMTASLDRQGGPTVAGVDVVDATHYPLSLSVTVDGRIRVRATYLTGVFDRTAVDRIGGQFLRVLDAMGRDPRGRIGDIDILGARDRELIESTWNDTARPLPPTTLSDLFRLQVARTPDAVALTLGRDHLTYQELHRRTKSLASRLADLGVGPETAVAVAMDRSFELIVSIYAILEAGGHYVPIDPDHSVERAAAILTESAAILGLTVTASAASLPQTVAWVAVDETVPTPDVEWSSPARPEHLAYVLFTSGSTGRPKGVAVTHAAITDQLRWRSSYLTLGPDDVVVQKTPVTFDVSTWELFLPLQVGARLVLAEPGGHRDPRYLVDLVRTQQVTAVHFVPSMLSAFAEEPGASECVSLRHILASGESLTADVARRARSIGAARVHNLYGPTEAAIDVTAHRVTSDDRLSVPIGRPVWNCTAAVLDDRLRTTPVGVVGELYLSGTQLARGYVGRRSATAERFVAAPGGSRMYRTGDLVRWSASGELEYAGRSDDQVKLRGQRIEPGEVDAALLTHRSVRRAATVVHEGEHLIAYVTGESIDRSDLMHAVAQRLPRFMVPSTIVVLDAMPVTDSGKLDRRALPAPVFSAATFRPPVTPEERLVADAVADVLGTTGPVGRDDDFFLLGGNSIGATTLASRLRTAFGVEVSVRTVFDAPTVSALARAIGETGGTPTRPALTPHTRPDRIPLSFAQQRMWFLNRFDRSTNAYVMPIVLRVDGALNVPALEAAVMDVLERHEVLRTIYPHSDGAPQQRILAADDITPPVAATVDDIGDVVAAARFDVTQDIPVRIHLTRIADQQMLVVLLHHIAADGWSLAPLTRDILLAYAARADGEAPSWSPLPVQYADYALWQYELLGEGDSPSSLAATQSAYWRARLAGLDAALDLPTDRARPARPTHRSDKVTFTVDGDTTTALRTVSAARRATLFMALHAALAVTLARWTSRDDIAVGTPVAGRNESATADLVGMFVNTLVLRTKIDLGAAFTDVLGLGRDTCLDAYAHADIPFERLVDELDVARTTSYHPLVQVMVAFQNPVAPALEVPGTSVTPVDVGSAPAHFDLVLDVTDNESDGLAASLTYATDLFDRASALRFVDHLGRILTAVAADPTAVVGDIELTDPGDVSRSGLPAVSPKTLRDLIADAVATKSAEPAVITDDVVLTYAELDARSDRLARVLGERGAGPDTVVALALPRSVDYVVALWATAKAGAAFLPLDPAQPLDRLRHILAESGALLGITTAEQSLPALDWLDWLDVYAVPNSTQPPITEHLHVDNLAYVIYTSGSTGTPKGVAITHRGLHNAVADQRDRCGDGADARVVTVAATTFDASIAEFLVALSMAAPLIVTPPSVYGGAELESFMRRHQVTHALVTPRVLESMDPQHLPALRSLISGGEACPPTVVRDWAPNRTLFNDYGPTESTIWAATSGPLAADDAVTIGTPVRGLRARVLDRRLNPVPLGVTGELYLVGDQLARGYLGNTARTAERFVASPGGVRMYRTGDLVRWTEQGRLIYLGRSDFQVKLRGLRIELTEIDAALRSEPAVRQSVTTVQNEQHLVSYVVGDGIDTDALMAALAARLPRYMVPTRIVDLPRLPLTTSGKLDRRALPVPVFAPTSFRAPITATERAIASCIGEVVHTTDPIGLDDEFFALGGNSLTATGLVARLNARLGTDVPVRAVFDAPRVVDLASFVDTAANRSDRTPLAAVERPDIVPLSYAQQRMWFLNRFDSGTTTYAIPLALRLTGVLDRTALDAAVGDVVERHEVLRTVYPESDGSPYQVISASDPVRIIAVPDGRIHHFVSAPFDVRSDIPIRVGVVESGENERILIVALHHIAADGWSMAPLTRDIVTAYSARAAGTVPEFPPLPVQYADFAVWQRDSLGRPDDPRSMLGRQLAYWTDHLTDLPAVLDLPTDRPRPAVASRSGDRVQFRIDGDTTSALRTLAARHRASLFMVVRTAFAVALSRWSGSVDIAIGTAVAGRTDPALDDLVGMFVNTVVLRTVVDPMRSFDDTLSDDREDTLRAFERTDLPFDVLVEELDVVRSTAHHPLVQVMLAFQNTTPARLEMPGLTVEPIDLGSAPAVADLILDVTETADGLDASVTYAVDLFDRATIERFAALVVRVLTSVAAQPSDAVGSIDVLEPGERADLLGRTGGTAMPPRPLRDILADAVATDPSGLAVITDDSTLTYAELDECSDRLARVLLGRGAAPDVVVALALPRSVDYLVALWAVTKTGAAFLPLDPTHPLDRLRHIVTESGAVLGVATDGNALPHLDWVHPGALPDDVPAAPAPAHVDNLAYVIYTSGSTGTPKGVAVTHRGLHNALADHRLERGSDPRVLAVSSPTFDASVGEVLIAAALAAPLVIAPPTVFGGDALTAFLEGHRVTHAMLTPRALESLDRTRLGGLRIVLSVGEACPPDLAAAWAPNRLLYNEYGPSETTIWATSAGPMTADGTVTIGRPLRGQYAWVLDSRFAPVPVGVVGELYLTGDQLARGYIGNPARTAERFVAAPGGARMYRSGDLVRWNTRGELVYLGRSDFQVKLRGLRIELDEIDSALCLHPTIRQSVTVVTDDHLVSYVVGHGIDTGIGIDIDSVATLVASRVPRYMVPDRIVELDQLPLTTSGKVDRRALPAPAVVPAEFRPPVTAAEVAVATAIADVLSVDVERIGLGDNFFALGGNSLSATRVVSRLSAAVDADVSVRAVFEASDVASLASLVEQAPSSGRIPLAAMDRPDRPPLSFAQSRMWFLNRFDRSAASYTIPVALRLTGELDVAALKSAIDDAVERHDVLRTVYPEFDGVPYQKVLPAQSVPLTPILVSESDVATAMAEFATAAFDVTTDTPMRVMLLSTSASDHVIVIVVHHIAADGWSMAPLTRDVIAAYTARAAGTAPSFLPLPVQYIDYAMWQRAVVGERAEQQLDYWKTRLAGVPDALDLPTDRPRTDRPTRRSGRVPVVLGPGLTARLRAFAAEREATLFMVLQTALAVTLARWSGTDDITVGIPTAGRGDPLLDDLVGMFVNTVAVRTEVRPAQTFSELVRRSRTDASADMGHADIPFEQVVEALDPIRSTAHHPVFQVLLAFQNTTPPELELPGLTIAPVHADTGVTQFDLTLDLTDRPDAATLDGAITYARDLFDAATIDRLVDMFVRIVEGAVAEPDRPVGDIDLLDAAQRRAVLDRTGGAHRAPTTLPAILTALADEIPDAVAIVDGDRNVSYAELSRRSDRLARALLSAGAGPDIVVASALTRSVESMVALWAVTKAGAALLPVDPRFPSARIESMLAESDALLGLTTTAERPDESDFWWCLDDRDALARLNEIEDGPLADDELPAPLHPDNLAYVLFTSGSTGRPKGVAVTHAGLENAVAHHRSRWDRPEDPRVAGLAPTTFDTSIGELILVVGLRGTLVIAPPAVYGGDELSVVLRRHRVTHALITPRALATVDPDGLDHLEHVISVGEACPPELVSMWAPSQRMYNDYGPTETTVWATASGPMTAGEPVTIGSAVRGVRTLVLDRRLHPVPVGVTGELYLSGPQLARGYLGRHALTAERFVAEANGVGGSRMYRTGDLVRWDEDGELIYLGRSDFQVKVRGQRIELGEIDSALLAQEGVDTAATIVHHDASVGDRLVSYVSATNGSLDTSALLRGVADTVPQYMVPTQIIEVDALPLTTSGKLDRRRLPAPVVVPAVFRAPVTATERAVADAVAEVLGLDRADVGLDDDFFALGGNSLAATRLAAQITRSTSIDAPLRTIFTRGTVEAIAAQIDTTTSTAWETVVALDAGGDGAPVFCIHPMLGLAWPYVELASRIGEGRTVFGVHSPALTDDEFDPNTMSALLTRYVDEIRKVHPSGPFHLLGWSIGGVLAQAIAERMAADGHGADIVSLTMLDPVHSITPGDEIKTRQFHSLYGDAAAENPSVMPIDSVRDIWQSMGGDALPVSDEQALRVTRAMLRIHALVDVHEPRPWNGPVLLVDSDVTTAELSRVSDFWAPYCDGPTTTASVPSRHGDMMTARAVDHIAPHVLRWIEERD